MTLTNKQLEGLAIAINRYRNGEKYTVISGYAGSGKSTLIKYIIAGLQIDPNEVAYVAFTGKAATVLRNKGCENAITAHKLLYDAFQTKEGEFRFKPKESLDENYRVIVVDEVSMLPAVMWNRLLTHNVYVLACGDPGQLPPIDPTENNHVLDNPHIFLDEVMRQAQDSEIIRLSMHIREGKNLSSYQGTNEQVKIITTKEVIPAMYNWADQVLCATNEMRQDINNFVRKIRGYNSEPQVGDKIIGLQNQWDFFSQQEAPLTNGTIGFITSYNRKSIYAPRYIYSQPIHYMYTSMTTEEGDKFKDIPIDYQYFKTREAQLNPSQISKLKENKYFHHRPPFEFSYAYAITTWKAQGSEWEKVMGFEESFPRDRIEHQKFLYTMITRASKKIVLVMKP